uniref:Neur_chan_LBD domain-containing protein n=1 Tax=Strongyloides papillosus TaxID=174720 RepID=A0A0N5C1S4_STREA
MQPAEIPEDDWVTLTMLGDYMKVTNKSNCKKIDFIPMIWRNDTMFTVRDDPITFPAATANYDSCPCNEWEYGFVVDGIIFYSFYETKVKIKEEKLHFWHPEVSRYLTGDETSDGPGAEYIGWPVLVQEIGNSVENKNY